MPYVKGATFKKMFCVSTTALREWADTGKIDSIRTPGGIRLYKLLESEHAMLANQDAGASVAYIRVSSAKQKDDLERQRAFMCARCPDHEIVADIGPGINWKRKGLLALLERAHNGGLKEVVVASRDRLCRFAFELLENVFQLHGVKLTVLESTDSSPEEELSDDLLSIVQIFCCRRNGRRRYGGKDAKDQTQPNTSPKASAEEVC